MPTQLNKGGQSYVELVHTMGTVVTIDVRATPPPPQFGEAVAAAGLRLQSIDTAFSTWQRDSWITRLISEDISTADCPDDVRDVLRLAAQLADLTSGYFSPYWDGRGPDPTGLVKGWAAQEVSDILLAHDLHHHVVNAAGDLIVAGSASARADAAPWRLGISSPFESGELAGVVEVHAPATRWVVATSGTLEHGCHVVDPHTGDRPASIVSATTLVEARSDDRRAGGTADASATALVAAGDDAATLLGSLRREAIKGFVVHADGRMTDPGGLLAPT